MSYKSLSYENTAASVIRNLEKRNMTGYYCATKEEAREKVLSLIPEGSSITWGGTETMTQLGVFDAIREKNYELIDRATAKTPEESRALYAKMVCADYFLTSANAITLDGEIVNIDGNSNRVACIAYGPSHVIIAAGMNKLVANLDAAIARVKTFACPPNAVRVGASTPCARTGVCADCLSPDSICCQTLITRKSRHDGRIIVILVGEELGF